MSWRREIGRFNNFTDKTHFAVLSRYNASNEESHLVATPFSKIQLCKHNWPIQKYTIAGLKY